jgi:Flp pilus assembly CpaF family ATPase
MAGKTTMLNCLASAIPGHDRVVSAEEVFELRFPHPDWVAMQTRQSGLEGTGEIRLRDLVKESLRMRPSRILGGQIEGCESSALWRPLRIRCQALHRPFSRKADTQDGRRVEMQFAKAR